MLQDDPDDEPDDDEFDDEDEDDEDEDDSDEDEPETWQASAGRPFPLKYSLSLTSGT
jgi:hypothetical protein